MCLFIPYQSILDQDSPPLPTSGGLTLGMGLRLMNTCSCPQSWSQNFGTQYCVLESWPNILQFLVPQDDTHGSSRVLSHNMVSLDCFSDLLESSMETNVV